MYPPFSPILVHIGPFSIHWYGIIMTTAIFVGTYVASRYVARHGQNPNSVWEMLFGFSSPPLLVRVFTLSLSNLHVVPMGSNIIWHTQLKFYRYGKVVFIFMAPSSLVASLFYCMCVLKNCRF